MKIFFPFLLSFFYNVHVVLGVVYFEKYCLENGPSIQTAIDNSKASLKQRILIEYCINDMDLFGRGDSYGTDIIIINKTIDFICPYRYYRCSLSYGTFTFINSIVRIENIDFLNTQFRAETNSKINISYVAFRNNTNTFRNTKNNNIFNTYNSSVLFNNVVFDNNDIMKQGYGILYADGGEYLNLSSVKIVNNSAQRIFSVRNVKRISILNTTFNSNYANSSSATLFSESNNSNAMIVNTSFINNTAFLTSALNLSGIGATIRDVLFANNTGIEKRINDLPTSLITATTVTIQSSNVILDNSSFIGNKGMNGYRGYSAITVDCFTYPWLFLNTSLSYNSITTLFLDNVNPSQTFFSYPRNVYLQSFSNCSAISSQPSGFFRRIGNWLRSILNRLLGRTE